MRKAQIEIMGLVVIVILITIGLFFSLIFKQQPDTKPPLDVYSDEQLSMNFLITFLETNINPSIKMHDVVVDCARFTVNEKGNYNINGKDSCDVTEEILEQVLEKTLERWNYDYKFTLTYDSGSEQDEIITLTSTEGCTGELSAPGWIPISLFRVVPGKIILQLDICT